MCTSRPKAPKPPPRLPEAPMLPQTGPTEGASGDDRRRRIAAGQGAAGTILTSSRGLTSPAQTQRKTLLGA